MGFDHAPIQKLFLCKPTKSITRYIQQLGRGVRALAGVLDGLSFAHQRRDAIANSAKSCCEVFDITDASRHCQLITALDVLAGPDVPANIVKRAKKAAEGGAAPVEPDAALEQAAAEEAREQQAREHLEKERRRELIIGVTFSSYSRDPFAEAEVQEKPKRRGWHMKWGKFKGQPVADMDTEYLRKFYNFFLPKTKDRAFMAGILNELNRRKRPAV
jgi:superfamily II DNA or RNA helicase